MRLGGLRRGLMLLVMVVGGLTLVAGPIGSAGAATKGAVRTIKLRGSTPRFPSAGTVSHGAAVNLTEDGKLMRWTTRSDSARPATRSLNGKRVMAAAATPSWLPTVAPTPVHAGALGLRSGWEGLNEADNDRTAGFSVEPPDQGLCAGNGYVLEAINDVVRVYNRGGTPVTPVISLNAFMGYPEAYDPTTDRYGPELTDPSCLYDAGTGRFYVTELTLDVDPATGDLTLANHVDIAVSKTSNPTGGWFFYSIPTTDTGGANGPLHTDCPCIGDFPHIGTDSHGFYVTTNEYPWSDGPGVYGNNFNGAQIYAMSKTALANGAALLPIVHFENTYVTAGKARYPGFALWPTLNPGTDYPTAANGSEYFTSSLAAEEARPTDFNGHAAHIVLWQISNTKSLDAANPALTLGRWRIASESYGVPPVSGQKTGPTPLRECLQTQCQGFGDPYQPDAEGGLDSSDSRMLTAWYVNGRVITALDTALTVNGSLQAGPAWFSITPSGSRSAVTSQGYIGVAGNNVIYPAIATTSTGTGAVALTLSGSSHFPSAAYATWGAGGPGDVWTASEGRAPEDGFCEYTYFNCAGTPTPQIRPRWGDYGAAVFDGTNLYVASEYIAHSCTFQTFSSDPTCGGTRSFYGNFSTRITRLTPGAF